MSEQATQRPALCTDEVLTYLDDLRESGETNMFGAASYLVDEFSLTRRDAKECLVFWMRTFDQRHPQT